MSEENFDMESENGEGNAGWADAIAKVLRTKKPKGRKSIVLSRAKRLNEKSEKKEKVEKLPFEIEDENGEVKKEEILVKEEVQESEKAASEAVSTKKRKRDTTSHIRVKPSISDREKERTLQKIATRGVVQLFNAVREQQTDINVKLKKAGALDRKQSQVLKKIDKNKFLDKLMGETKSTQVEESKSGVKNEKETKDKKLWSVLRDDFVIGASMKNWDKESSSDDSAIENKSSAEED